MQFPYFSSLVSLLLLTLSSVVQSGPCKPGPYVPKANCQPHVIDSGTSILNQFPGVVTKVVCYENKEGDHGFGLALDIYHKTWDPVGQEIAVYIMNNACESKVKIIMSYVLLKVQQMKIMRLMDIG